jgi:hypothetical protein
LRDLAGNVFSGTTSLTFTAALVSDTTSPVVTGTTVADGQTAVATNSVLSVQFNEAVNGLKLDGVVLSRVSDGQAVTVVRSLSADQQILTLTPQSPLLGGESYQLVVDGVEDLAGNRLASPASYGFTTSAGVDTKVPTLVTRSPLANATNVPLNTVVSLGFDKRLDPITVTANSVYLYDQVLAQKVAGSLSLSADGKTVNFTPAGPLAAGRLYYVYVLNGLKDLVGTVVTSTAFTFTTGQ